VRNFQFSILFMLTTKRNLWVIIAILSVGLFLTYKVYNLIFATGVQLPAGAQTYELIIPTGWDYTKIGQKLLADKILTEPKAFDILAKKMGYPDHIKPGRYEIKAGMSNKEVISMLRSGKQSPVKFTFTNARTKEELMKKIQGKFEFNTNDLLALLNDAEFLKGYGLTPDNAIAFFIPNTYEIYWNKTPKQFFERMRDEYNRFWNEKRNAKREKYGLTRLEIVTIASIVEEETNKNDEKPRVAGVYLNRVKKKWKLDADPTLKFAWGDFTIKRVLNSHKTIDSPYNTYMYAGIPPGPICTPSTTTIDAVLDAEDHEYMFFCAKADGSGYHAFAKTQGEQDQNAAEYHKHLDEVQK